MASADPLGFEAVPGMPSMLECTSTRSVVVDNAYDSFAERTRDLESWSRKRILVRRALNHTATEIGLAALITASIVLVVIETNYSADAEDDIPAWMTILSTVILTMFCVEVGWRVYVERKRFFKNSWYLFDLLVASVDAISTVLHLAFDIDSVPVEFFRLVRVMKMMRAVRLLAVFPELYLIIHCLAAAVKAIMWAALMMAVVLGFWGILAVLLIHPLNMELAKKGFWESQSCERCPRAFASVQQSMLTFAQQVVAGDSWGMVTVPLIENYPLTGFFFFAVLISITMAVMNVILAVIVDRATEVKETSLRDEALKKDQDFLRASQQLFNICKDIDKDGSGCLTFQELWAGFKSNPEFASIMSTMDIGVSDLEVVFHILDVDGSNSLDYKEFVDQLHMMKNSDAHTLLVFIKFYVMELRHSMQGLTKQDTQVSCSRNRLSPNSQAGLSSDASATGAAAGHRLRAQAETGGSRQCDTERVITATLQETMDLLDMQQELADVLRRHEDACKDHIRQLEAIVSLSPRTGGSAEPGHVGAGSSNQASGFGGETDEGGSPMEGPDQTRREGSPAKSAARATPARAVPGGTVDDQSVPPRSARNHRDELVSARV